MSFLLMEKLYITGGAIRDTLLGRPVKDIDYVVVGSTPEEMLKLGFKQVGKDFPVFLDDNGDEYALARTEHKTGNGYYGFTTNFNPGVTLEEDLERRDLTMNAFAVNYDNWDEFKKTKNRSLVIDYFNGLQDLDDGILKHISCAFADDPVRVLRIARFAARYDFDIDLETYRLMAELVEDGELDHLTQERVWAETVKAVMEDNPLAFFQVLDVVGAYGLLFSEMAEDNRLPITVGDTLNRSILFNGSLIERLIIITAGMTPEDVVNMFHRLKAPNDVIKMLQMSCTLFRGVLSKTFAEYHTTQVFKLLNAVNAWKNVERFQTVMRVFAIFDNPYLNKNAYILLKALMVGNAAKFDMLTSEQQDKLKGADISNAIADIRFDLIKKVIDG